MTSCDIRFKMCKKDVGPYNIHYHGQHEPICRCYECFSHRLAVPSRGPNPSVSWRKRNRKCSAELAQDKASPHADDLLYSCAPLTETNLQNS